MLSGSLLFVRGKGDKTNINRKEREKKKKRSVEGIHCFFSTDSFKVYCDETQVFPPQFLKIELTLVVQQISVANHRVNRLC